MFLNCLLHTTRPSTTLATISKSKAIIDPQASITAADRGKCQTASNKEISTTQSSQMWVRYQPVTPSRRRLQLWRPQQPVSLASSTPDAFHPPNDFGYLPTIIQQLKHLSSKEAERSQVNLRSTLGHTSSFQVGLTSSLPQYFKGAVMLPSQQPSFSVTWIAPGRVIEPILKEAYSSGKPEECKLRSKIR